MKPINLIDSTVLKKNNYYLGSSPLKSIFGVIQVVQQLREQLPVQPRDVYVGNLT